MAIQQQYLVSSGLFDSKTTTVLRGTWMPEGLPVVVKLLKSSTDTFQAGIARLRHEFNVLRSLASPWVVKALSLERGENSLALVMEDIGALSLREHLRTSPFELLAALWAARGIASGLGDIHANNVIHQDLSPDNVVYNASSGRVQIIDFEFSSVLPEEHAELDAPYKMRGTLPYISPEQTGRMNRPVDYRSDFYSLGACLYEMLTGRPPFEFDDPIDFAHAHIAIEPALPSSLREGIPNAVDQVVMKLLAKHAEERYQSAAGIVYDLDRCVEQLNTKLAPPAFSPGAGDRSTRFRLHKKLYGRGPMTEDILGRLSTLAGKKDVLLVSGPSGIGKTALVQELYRPITKARGCFVGGKFDPLRNDQPYAALLSAFGELLRIVLCESDAQLAQWRTRLAAAVGGNGRVITDLLPEAAHIIGPQPELPKLEPEQELNRLQLVFRQFVQSCCSHAPLVLFLDDLQWADAASLALLEKLLADPAIVNVMVILAYRDNELHAGHPVSLMLERVAKPHGPFAHYAVGPLEYRHIEQMVSDAVEMRGASVEALAAVVHDKTDGTPLFVEQFLAAAAQRKLLRFDITQRHWAWDLNAIRTMEQTSNVLELVEAKVRTLDEHAQRILRDASCIGNRFDLHTLATVAALDVEQTLAALRTPLQEALLIPIGDAYRLAGADSDRSSKVEYRFAHDRVQQAAYALLPEAQRAERHLQIGRLLHGACGGDAAALEAGLFEIVNHVNLGAALVSAPEERALYTSLNERAARKAVSRAAYELAYCYYEMASAFGGTALWNNDHERCFDLHCELARTAYLAKRDEACENLLAQLLRKARDRWEQVKALKIDIVYRIARGDSERSVQAFLRASALMGRKYPRRVSKLHFVRELARIAWRLRKTPLESLAQLPPMQDRRQLEINHLDCLAATSLYNSRPDLFAVVRLQDMVAAIDHGTTRYTPQVFAGFGLILCGALDRIDLGYRFGKLALSMLGDPAYRTAQGRVQFIVANFMAHWKEPLADTLPCMLQAYQSVMEVGTDFEYAGFGIVSYFLNSVHCGRDLAQIEAELERWKESIDRLNIKISSDLFAIFHQLVHQLRNGSSNPCTLRGEHFDATASNMVAGLQGYYLSHVQLLLATLFGNHAQRVEAVERNRALLRNGVGMYHVSYFCFAEALAVLRAPKVDAAGIRRARHNLANLRRWCKHQPANHQHHVFLLEAELLRVSGQAVRAMEKYDQAIDAAKRLHLPHAEGLASELCGEFYLSLQRKPVAAFYLEQARVAYALWGCAAKTAQLQERHGELLAAQRSALGGKESMGSTGSVRSSSDVVDLDMTALGRVTKSIAEELQPYAMVKKTLDAAMRIAGAKTGALLVLDEGYRLEVVGAQSVEAGAPAFEHSPNREDCRFLVNSIVDYVRRTGEAVAVDDACQPQHHLPGLHNEPHIVQNQVRSIVCVPVVSGMKADTLAGVLYLENQSVTGAFNRRHLSLLEIIASTIAARLDMHKLATTDQLTRLANRAHFDQVFKDKIEIARLRHQGLSLIMIDIDRFKSFNDDHGHQAGDAVLQHVASVLRSCCRARDLCARYGGEELCVIVPNASKADAAQLAQRIRKSIESSKLAWQDKVLSVTASLGVASLGEQCPDETLLLQAADQAMYRAKQGGRNQVQLA